jgi:hypothetical protein
MMPFLKFVIGAIVAVLAVISVCAIVVAICVGAIARELWSWVDERL